MRDEIPGLERFEPRWLVALRAGFDNRGPSHDLTRFVLLRLLGLVYTVAFSTALFQGPALLGSKGLTPIASYLPRLVEHFESRAIAVIRAPTLFWASSSDGFLMALALAGLVLSLCLLAGFANAKSLLALWVLHLSFVNVGQLWYNFGWEIQLAETGFLAVFLVPWNQARPFPTLPAPTPVIWLYRWLALRIMLGAGLIKVRGDDCWLALTCLDYHFETQPVPGPLSAWFHHAPHAVHATGVALNHVVELVAPLFALGPRRLRIAAGAAMALFQGILIASGNLSYLNWLTLIPILACFDDAVFSQLLPQALARRAERAREGRSPSRAQRRATLGIFGVVVVLSIAPIWNLVSSEQAMNRSFEPLGLVNTYGAFGSVGRVRSELVIEGTLDASLGPTTVWREYEFRAKPGDPLRRPPWLTPYHRRLDWLMWFAAMGSPQEYPFVVQLLAKLLEGDANVRTLLARDPFDGRAPEYVRVLVYRYELVSPLSSEPGHFRRTLGGTWLPPLSKSDPRLREFLFVHGFRADGIDPTSIESR